MGYFNITCAITGGAIEAGDNVYLIPIQKNPIQYVDEYFKHKNKNIKSVFIGQDLITNEDWTLVAPPFNAVYNDDGFEIKNIFQIKPFIQFLEKNGMIITEIWHNNEVSFDIEDFKINFKELINQMEQEGCDFSTLFNLIACKRIIAENIYDENQNSEIQFCVVKEDVLNDFIDMFEEWLELVSQYQYLKDMDEDEEKTLLIQKAIKLHPFKAIQAKNIKEKIKERDLLKFVEKIVKKKSLLKQDLIEIKELLEKHEELISKRFCILNVCLKQLHLKDFYQSKEIERDLSNYVLNCFWQTYLEDNINQINIKILFNYTYKMFYPFVSAGQDNNYYETLYVLYKKENERRKIKNENMLKEMWQ